MLKNTHKYNGKVFKLCDSKDHTYSVKVYSGKGTNITPELLMGTLVVLDLIDLLFHFESTIYNYCSPELAKGLLQRETHLVGTIRSDRFGLPKDLVVNVNLKRGPIIAAGENEDGIVVTKWLDKSSVHMLSTKHPVQYMDTNKKKTAKVILSTNL